jgi:hypothetical protein
MKKITLNTLISSSLSKYLSHNRIYFWLGIFAFLITISACDNPDLNSFKTPLVNDTFGTKSVDTFSLIIRTELIDSIPSYNFTQDLIGCYKDGITGKTIASTYFNFRLPSATIKLPTSININSVTLNLRYSGLTNYFGNITERQSFNIYEISQKLKSDSIYYSTYKPAYSTSVGKWSGVMNPADTILHITLTNDFGKKLLSGNAGQLSTNDSFQNFFRGLAIVPEDKVFTGAIVYFLLNHTQTTLSVKYNDTGIVIFPINGYSVRFSNFTHDYSGSIIKTQLNNPKAEYSDLPIQPMSGTKITIKLPYLKHLVDLNALISIHKAEITFPLDLNSPYNANVPKSLLLLKTDTANKFVSIIDHDYENYFGGLLNSSKTSYSFVITRYIQQLLQEYVKDPNYIDKYTLTLIIPSDNPITAAPVILKNIDASGNKLVKLKLWYSKL